MKSIYIIISTICIFCSSLSMAYAEEKGYYPYYTEDDYKVPEGAEKSFTIYTGEDGTLPPSRIVTGIFLEKVEAYEYLNEELDDVSMYSFKLDLMGVDCYTEEFYSKTTAYDSIVYILIEDEYFDANLNFEDKFYIQAVGSGNTISVSDMTSENTWGRPAGVEYTEDGKKVIEILTLYNPVEHKYYTSQKCDEIYGPIGEGEFVQGFSGTIYMGDIVSEDFEGAPKCYDDPIICEVNVLESYLEGNPKKVYMLCQRASYNKLLEENMAYKLIYVEKFIKDYDGNDLYMLDYIYLQEIEPYIAYSQDIEEAKGYYEPSELKESPIVNDVAEKTVGGAKDFMDNNKVTIIVIIVLLCAEIARKIIVKKSGEKKNERNS